GAVAELISPSVDLSTLESPFLSFDVFMFGSAINSLHVDVFANGTWNEDALVLSGPFQTAEGDNWSYQGVNLEDFAGEVVQIKFRAIRGAGTDVEIAVDNVSIEEAPDCIPPLQFTMSEMTN